MPVTQEEWPTCSDRPAGMIRLLRTHKMNARTKRRKHQLFACAGVRLMCQMIALKIPHHWVQTCSSIVQMVEQTADEGTAKREIISQTEHLLEMRPGPQDSDHEYNLWYALCGFREGSAPRAAIRVLDASWWSVENSSQSRDEFLSSRCDLVREVFGNPFHPLSPRKFPPHLVGLASAVYAALPEVGPDLPILLDALEEAGEVELGEHLRRPGHVKGCHVLDHILGR